MDLSPVEPWSIPRRYLPHRLRILNTGKSISCSQALRIIVSCRSYCARLEYRKSEAELFAKNFLKAEWFLVAKDPKGPVCLPPQGREAYQVSISYVCPNRPNSNDPFVPFQVSYARFVVPYEFGDGINRFARSDKFYRIYLPCLDGENLLITEYSEDQLFELMLDKEINGFVIKNAFSRKKIDEARNRLENIVIEVNKKKELSRYAFQALVALQILGSDKLVRLTEDYLKTSIYMYEAELHKSPLSHQSWDDIKWCPGPCPAGECASYDCNIAYVQVQSPAPDWKDYLFLPYYLNATDRRLVNFQNVDVEGTDFPAHYAILLDILAKAKSPFVEEIRRKNYPIPTFKAYFGDTVPASRFEPPPMK